MPPSRVRAEQSACPARELAPFCMFCTGRQDCGTPEGQEPLWRTLRPKGAKFKIGLSPPSSPAASIPRGDRIWLGSLVRR